GIIGYRALKRSEAPPGGRLGIYGFGSSAHVTLQVARARGCEVFVCTREASHRELARRLGATWAGDLRDSMPAKTDGTIIFAPVGARVPLAPPNFGRGGTLAPAGIHSTPVPALAYVVKEGRGAYLWDMNGRRYLDYLLGSGPMLLGHAHPAVIEAVERQVRRGTSYMLLNEPAIELAEELVRAVPCAEQVRYTSSGTEATFFALRVARAFRKRDKVMKFEGGFHGTHDYGMMSVSPRSPKAFPA